MKRHQFRYAYLCIALQAILILHSLSGPCLGAPKTQHVVLISIDGLADFHLENLDLKLPNIHELIASGVWANHSTTVFPSVTHPSHTSLITGVTPRLHGVVGNRVRNRKTGEAYHITNKPRLESVQVRTLFDWAKEKNLSTAAFFWPETKDDPSIDFNIAEVFNSRGSAEINVVSPELIKELQDAGIPIELYFEWYPDDYLRTAGDIILAQSAAYAIRHYKPALLAIHILATDVMQHAYGADDYMSHNSLTVADYCVGIIRDAIEQAGISDQTAIMVTGDHGFVTIEYDTNLKPVFEPLGNKVRLHPQGWTLFVETTDAFSPEADGPRLARALDEAQKIDGVARVLSSNQFPELGLPTYEESPLIPGSYLVLADVDTHLRASPTQPLGKVRKPQPYHGHGYLPEHPSMHVGFVAAGSDIRSGVRIDPIRSIDVAPTIAFLLGLKAEGVEGRILTEILESP
jgi:predicted AlkP superfamily pyrophosphatase or phosphodiesterase